MTTEQRFDMYGLIHKALRAFMGDTLTAVGRTDAFDDEDTAAALGRVRALLATCRMHLQKEDDFVHAALEARRPGSSARIAGEHVQHLDAIAALEALTEKVTATSGAVRAEAAARLYRALALFVADNFEHMHVEETEANPALWSAYTDAELIELHHALVASIAPRDMADAVRWIVPSASPHERAALLADIQRNAPAGVFGELLERVRSHLTARDWEKLMRALAPLPLAA